MELFRPQHIYIDASVENLSLSHRVRQHFPNTAVSVIDDVTSIKESLPMTEAKKTLVITRHKGGSVKTCQGLGDYVCCNLLTVSFASNCHLECTYCILQDYLANNPRITLYANTDEILQEIETKISAAPNTQFRLATGELADSLALDEITELSKELIPFAAKHKNLLLELRTKSDVVKNLLGLDHQGRTVVSWSMNPQSFIDLEEHKTASLKDRLIAARKCADAGYKIGLHFDPILHLPNWEEEYALLLKSIRSVLAPEEIAWISMGTLRFTPNLKKIAAERFPKSKIFLGELFPSQDGKIRYLRDIREDMLKEVKGLIEESFKNVPNYLCMETKTVWKNTYDYVPQSLDEVENKINYRFHV